MKFNLFILLYILFFFGCSEHLYDKEIMINVKKSKSNQENVVSNEFIKDVSKQDIDRLIISDANEIEKFDIVIYLINFFSIKEINSFLPVAKTIASDPNCTLGFVFLDDHDDENKYRMIATMFKLPPDYRKSYFLVQKKNEHTPIIIEIADFSQASSELKYILLNYKEKWENLLLAMQLKKGQNINIKRNINLNEAFKQGYDLINENSL